MRKKSVRLGPPLLVLAAMVRPTSAQEPRMVPLDGHSMRVQIVGQNNAGTGQPVVVFESGAGTGLGVWTGVLNEVARFARAVSYDRAGIGLSEPDGQPPTPRHVAQKLHRLLAQVDLRPPYVLVGHSWGGPLIRMFAALYPQDVAGLVYVDPTDLRSRAQDLDYLRASGYTTDEAARHIERVRERMAGYVSSRTGPYRAEMEVIQVNESSYSAEFRGLPPLAPIPVSVLIGGRFQPEIWTQRPCEPRECHNHWLQFRKKWLEELLPEVGEGTVTIAAGAGHEVQTDDPALVVSAIRRVLAAVGARPPVR
jgi:pimeloyl-ACP methyl ester carboxylesterase